MFGYDWPRLHAALNDLPAALLIGAVLFDLLAAATRREGLRIASFWTLMLGRWARRGGDLGTSGREPHRPRGGGAPAHGDPREARAHHRRDLRRAGALAALPRGADGQGERALALALGLGGAGCSSPRRLWRQAGVRACGRDAERGAAGGAPRAREGHHHGAGEEHGDGDEDHEHAEDAHETPPPGAPRPRLTAHRPATSIRPAHPPIPSGGHAAAPALTCGSSVCPDGPRPGAAPTPPARRSSRFRRRPRPKSGWCRRKPPVDWRRRWWPTRYRWRGSGPRRVHRESLDRLGVRARHPALALGHQRGPGARVGRSRASGQPVLTVETVYRPMADPSTPERELERQVPRTHPVAVKVQAELADLLQRWGGPPPADTDPGAAAEPPPEGEEQ